ncbi:uncharacterized protein UTRI_05967_B [Ustilago trichophora]|uniref:Uncharacterized protein n=1 Tax=Ustilago trichophora TaxID=86804 RepID=A0A5C3EL08_9BASI|nr:uncharacterized protein UTRI_05967_B [Ustilago trichophora]
MSSSHPITAGGAAAEYTHKFKKHFGDRPTSFALSGHSPNHRTPSSIPASLVMDPFAASASNSSFSHSSSSSTASVPSTPSTSSTIQQTFTSASTIPLRPGNLDNETHNTLANLGYRIRARVNQGYTRSSSSTTPFVETQGGGFRSERDVLVNVTNTRRGWSRVSTAPTVCSSFDSLRGMTDAMDTSMDPTMRPDIASKRERCFDSDTEDDEETQQPLETTSNPSQTTRRIAPMPKLSFTSSTSSSSSTSFSSSFSEMFPPERSTFLQPQPSPGSGIGMGFSRSESSSTCPFSSSTTKPSTSAFFAPGQDVEMSPLINNSTNVSSIVVNPTVGGDGAYDFSAHFDRTDF